MNPSKLARSAPFRLALAYVALFGISSVLLLALIYWSTAGYMIGQAEETIEAEVAGLSERYRLAGLPGLVDLVEARSGPSRAGSAVYLLVDAGYRHVAGNLRGWPAVDPDEQGWIRFRLADIRGGDDATVHEARAKVFPLRGGFWLLVGRDFHELETMQRRIVRTLAWGLAATVALALLGGALVGRSRIRRLAEINQAVGEIMEGDLTRRLPSRVGGDDFGELVANLNRMLDEIQRLMARVRQVSDNIAHDLRTPLSRLRHQLEILRGGEVDNARREAVEQAIREAESLLTTFNALLRIARIESGARQAGFFEIELGPLIEDVAAYYEPLADQRGQSLAVGVREGARLWADRDLLFQAVANLVDNAVKYAPEGGQVSLMLERLPDGARILVADDGPGIPEALRERVFERFYRADESRSATGNGLGLSLVAVVVRLHNGYIRLEDNAPGLRVVVDLPSRERKPTGQRSSSTRARAERGTGS